MTDSKCIIFTIILTIAIIISFAVCGLIPIEYLFFCIPVAAGGFVMSKLAKED